MTEFRPLLEMIRLRSTSLQHIDNQSWFSDCISPHPINPETTCPLSHITNPFASYKIWSAYSTWKAKCLVFFKKLRHCLLRLAPFLKKFRLCFYPLDVLDKFLDYFRACDFSVSNVHFPKARTRYMPYPECQCLKPPLFEEKLMHWLKRYKRRTSPSHIIYLAGLRLLLTTSMRPFEKANPQATCWEPKAWNAAPGSKPMSASFKVWQKSLERTWPTRFETNKKRS